MTSFPTILVNWYLRPLSKIFQRKPQTFILPALSCIKYISHWARKELKKLLMIGFNLHRKIQLPCKHRHHNSY